MNLISHLFNFIQYILLFLASIDTRNYEISLYISSMILVGIICMWLCVLLCIRIYRRGYWTISSRIY